MDKHHIITGSFICLICFFVLLWGCDKTPETPQQTKKVTQKIAAAKKTQGKAAAPQPASKKEKKKETAVVKPLSDAGPLKAKPGIPETKPEGSVSEKPPTEAAIGIADLYSSQGKLDPFEPLFQPKPVALAAKKKKRRSAPPTPLEKVSLSQLTLVAIIRAPDENKALVQEATGKGYIVKKGTYIGLNSGKIIQILRDRIIVEEEVEDVYGKTTISKKTLQLQKSPGE